MRRFAPAILCLIFLPAGEILKWSSFAPSSWEYWENHVADAQEEIDHSAWDSFLKRYITQDETGLNRFNYGGVTHADKAALDTYIKGLEAIEITNYAKPEQLAYWLNLYNAVTIQVVLDHYPVASIKDIDISGLLSNGPWKADLVTVEELELSLNAIEHDILRPIWSDPRIHYGVNCASIGCPNLHKTAFTGDNVDALLTTLARDFVNHPRGVTIVEGDVIVSSIYSWFAHDFGNSHDAVFAHISEYAEAPLRAKLQSIGSISDHAYDWNLNE